MEDKNKMSNKNIDNMIKADPRMNKIVEDLVDKDETVEINIDFNNIIEGSDGSMYYYDPEKDQMYKLLFDPKENQDKK